jgi:hypothetical protein
VQAQRLLLADLEQRGWQRPGAPDIQPFDARFVSAALPGHYVRRPFERSGVTTDFNGASINFPFADLLARATAPS